MSAFVPEMYAESILEPIDCPPMSYRLKVTLLPSSRHTVCEKKSTPMVCLYDVAKKSFANLLQMEDLPTLPSPSTVTLNVRTVGACSSDDSSSSANRAIED
eukprot:XP_001705770.1 Hypothetical protein GL50803_20232 [Giardia lamblia ATCC 50803]